MVGMCNRWLPGKTTEISQHSPCSRPSCARHVPKAGLSRDALAALINYSGSLVCLIENTTRVPTLAFAQRLDEALGTTGTFERMQAHLRAAPFPAWFRDWVETEREATALRTWQQPNIMIQVISHKAGAHEGVNGAFIIADCKNAPSVVYLETALTGLVVDNHEDVAAVTLIYETLRGEALPRARSLEMLKEVARSWT